MGEWDMTPFSKSECASSACAVAATAALVRQHAHPNDSAITWRANAAGSATSCVTPSAPISSSTATSSAVSSCALAASVDAASAAAAAMSAHTSSAVATSSTTGSARDDLAADTLHVQRRRSLGSASCLSSGDEDDSLKEACAITRDDALCNGVHNGEAARLESGRWSMAEHKRFVEGLRKFGRRKWIRIAQHVGTRTVIQVRSHAQKYFKKLRKEEMLVEDRRPALETTRPHPHFPTHALAPAPHAAILPSSFGLAPFGPPHAATWGRPTPSPPSRPPQPSARHQPPIKSDADEEATGGLALLTAAAHILDKSRKHRCVDEEAATVKVDRDETSDGSDDLSYQLVYPFATLVPNKGDFAGCLMANSRRRSVPQEHIDSFGGRSAQRQRRGPSEGLVF